MIDNPRFWMIVSNVIEREGQAQPPGFVEHTCASEVWASTHNLYGGQGIPTDG